MATPVFLEVYDNLRAKFPINNVGKCNVKHRNFMTTKNIYT